ISPTHQISNTHQVISDKLIEVHRFTPSPGSLNRHQPKKRSSTPVGARAADEGLGGPLGSPASCSSRFYIGGTRSPPTPRATLKALPTPHHPLSPLRIIRLCAWIPGLD